MTHTLILLRHGESEWNAKNLFTGWVDVASPRRAAPRPSAAASCCARPGCCPTSCTPRCSAARSTPPTSPSTPPTGTGSRCAARGGSTSATTARCRARTRSRRSRSTARSSSCSGAARFDVPPPPLDDDDEFSQVGDPRYADLGDEMPRTECLKDVIARMLPYWESGIVPGPAGRPDRAGRRPRQQPARRSSSTSTRSATRTSPASTSPPACRWSTASTTTCARPSPGGEYLDPEAAAGRRRRRRQPGPLSPSPVESPTNGRRSATGRDRRVTADRRLRRRTVRGFSPVTTKTTRLATETAWSAIRS